MPYLRLLRQAVDSSLGKGRRGLSTADGVHLRGKGKWNRTCFSRPIFYCVARVTLGLLKSLFFYLVSGLLAFELI